MALFNEQWAMSKGKKKPLLSFYFVIYMIKVLFFNYSLKTKSNNVPSLECSSTILGNCNLYAQLNTNKPPKIKYVQLIFISPLSGLS